MASRRISGHRCSTGTGWTSGVPVRKGTPLVLLLVTVEFCLTLTMVVGAQGWTRFGYCENCSIGLHYSCAFGTIAFDIDQNRGKKVGNRGTARRQHTMLVLPFQRRRNLTQPPPTQIATFSSSPYHIVTPPILLPDPNREATVFLDLAVVAEDATMERCGGSDLVVATVLD